MAQTKDLKLNDGYTVQLGIFPKLGLIIINDLRDFAENWLEVLVTQEAQTRMDISIKTLGGHGESRDIEGACRYLIGSIINPSKKEKFEFESHNIHTGDIGCGMKFIVNINLKEQILKDRASMKLIEETLLSLFKTNTETISNDSSI